MEQLQQTLEQRVEAGNSYSIINDFYIFKCWEYYIENEDEIWWYTVSYHELFSKDSWLMDFMKWKTDKRFIREWWEYSNWQTWYNWCTRDACRIYQYMIMWPMSATEKINYFNTNAYLPWNVPSVD